MTKELAREVSGFYLSSPCEVWWIAESVLNMSRSDGTMSSWLLHFRNFTNFHTVSYIIWTPLWTKCASAAAILSNISADVYCANNALRISSFVAVVIYWLAGCGRRAFRLWGWSFHDLFKAVRSILMYAISFPDIVKVQETEPYKRTGSTPSRKKFLFRLSGRFDFHILSSWFRASHTFPSLLWTSCSVEAM